MFDLYFKIDEKYCRVLHAIDFFPSTFTSYFKSSSSGWECITAIGDKIKFINNVPYVAFDNMKHEVLNYYSYYDFYDNMKDSLW